METDSTMPPAMGGVTQTRKHYCENCGQHILSRLPNCPHCQAKQKSGVDKASLILITVFFGALGGHKFYLKRYGMGIFYFLFAWTGLTFVAAIIEMLIYSVTETEKLRDKYPEVNNLAPVIIVPVIAYAFAMIGILAAIAIPNFISYRMKAYDKTAETAAQSAFYACQNYFEDAPDGHATLNELAQYGYQPPSGVKLIIDPNTYEELMIKAYHSNGKTMYVIDSYGQQVEMGKPSDLELLE